MSVAAARPVVSVFSTETFDVASTTTLPAVFTAPIRPDVVNFVHTNMAKNKRQPYAVSYRAGHQTSAVSWGTGRAVSRIPRVGGGGTQRSGQGAFGNMCRSGRMFNPTKVYRKWNRKVNQGQRRFATASALAASALPALVMARGHHIDEMPEVPLVLNAGFESCTKTAAAYAMLQEFGVAADVDKVKASKKLRAGIGKLRNRRYVQRRGPLLVYNEDNGITKAFRNLPGVELCHVDRLNLLQLAPGGHVGRLVVWSEGAFQKLDALWGTYTKASTMKKGFNLPQRQMNNSDLARIINSDEVQNVVRAANTEVTHKIRKRNPLTNADVRIALNPYAKVLRDAEMKVEADKSNKRAAKKARMAASKKADGYSPASSKAVYERNNSEE